MIFIKIVSVTFKWREDGTFQDQKEKGDEFCWQTQVVHSLLLKNLLIRRVRKGVINTNTIIVIFF